MPDRDTTEIQLNQQAARTEHAQVGRGHQQQRRPPDVGCLLSFANTLADRTAFSSQRERGRCFAAARRRAVFRQDMMLRKEERSSDRQRDGARRPHQQHSGPQLPSSVRAAAVQPRLSTALQRSHETHGSHEAAWPYPTGSATFWRGSPPRAGEKQPGLQFPLKSKRR